MENDAPEEFLDLNFVELTIMNEKKTILNDFILWTIPSGKMPSFKNVKAAIPSRAVAALSGGNQIGFKAKS